MSSNSIKFHYVGERGVNENPHVHLDNNNGSDFNIEQIFLYDLIYLFRDLSLTLEK